MTTRSTQNTDSYITHARRCKHQKVLEWAKRYRLLLQRILLDDTMSVKRKVEKLRELRVPTPLGKNRRWSRANVYAWTAKLPAVLDELDAVQQS